MAKKKRSKAEEENLLAEMLEDLSKASGVDLGEILASQDEEPEEFQDYPIGEEPTEDEELDTSNEHSSNTDEYFNDLFDDIGVDADEPIRDTVEESP